MIKRKKKSQKIELETQQQKTQKTKKRKFDYLKELRQERKRKMEENSKKGRSIPLDDRVYLNHDYDDREVFTKKVQPNLIQTMKNSQSQNMSRNYLSSTYSTYESTNSNTVNFNSAYSRKSKNDIIQRNIKNVKKLKPIDKEKLKRPQSYNMEDRKKKKTKKKKKIKEHLFKYADPLERELASFIEDDCENLMSYSVLDLKEDLNREEDPRKLVNPRIIDPLNKTDLFWKMQNKIKKVYSRAIESDFEQSMKNLNLEDMSSMGNLKHRFRSDASSIKVTMPDFDKNLDSNSGVRRNVMKEVYSEETPREFKNDFKSSSFVDGGTTFNIQEDLNQAPGEKEFEYEVVNEFEEEVPVNVKNDEKMNTTAGFKVPEHLRTHGTGLGFAYDSKADTYYKVKKNTQGTFGKRTNTRGSGKNGADKLISIEVNQNLENFSETAKSEMNPFAPFDSKYKSGNTKEKFSTQTPIIEENEEEGIKRVNPKEQYLKQKGSTQVEFINSGGKHKTPTNSKATTQNSNFTQKNSQNSYASNFSKRKNAAFRSANSSTLTENSGRKRYKRKAYKMPKYMNENANSSGVKNAKIINDDNLVEVKNEKSKKRKKGKNQNKATLKINPNYNMKDLFT